MKHTEISGDISTKSAVLGHECRRIVEVNEILTESFDSIHSTAMTPPIAGRRAS